MVKYLSILMLVVNILSGKVSAQTLIKKPAIDLKVCIMGAPSFPQVEWNDKNLSELVKLGFNAVQLNIAWGYRPNDEALNLEDVVTLPKEYEFSIDIDSAKTLRTGERIKKRSEELKKRIALCKKYKLHTIFHFGAPFVGYPPQEPFDNCISNKKTIERYIYLIGEFHKQYPGVDDLLIYTYDQNAWLCSEYGPCKNCHGIPLPERVSNFVNTLGQTWKKFSPRGTVWWEPWEISAGQVYKTIDLLDSAAVSLSIHSSIAEVQIAFPADRWFKNVLIKAAERKIAVLGEAWLGGATEELEPYINIAVPLATLGALKAMYNAGKLKGIKEYYGNIPGKEDPNLRMTGIFFNNPSITDDNALSLLAAPYGKFAKEVSIYWRLTSEAIELYPWDVSWLAREVGRSDPDHLLSAAILKGASWQTPSWQSSRRSSFMRTDETNEPNFWMKEDIQLRFEQAAKKMESAIEMANKIKGKIPMSLTEYFQSSINELSAFRRTTLAYVYHLRETNLTAMMRNSLEAEEPFNQENLRELKELLLKDSANMINSAPINTAINLLNENVEKFLKTYFLHTGPTYQKAGWNITSD